MSLDNLQNGLQSAIGVIKANPVASSVVGGSLLAGGVVGAVAISRRKRRKTRKSKSVRKKSSRSRSRKRGRNRRTPRTAGKGKDRSTKRIRYTKNGQPYVIMKSGKARFIKMSSAKKSHRRKGGRY